MNTDLIVFIAYIGIFLVGFAAGRWEKRDSYVRGYRRGKLVGEAAARFNAIKSVEVDYQKWLKNDR